MQNLKHLVYTVTKKKPMLKFLPWMLISQPQGQPASQPGEYSSLHICYTHTILHTSTIQHITCNCILNCTWYETNFLLVFLITCVTVHIPFISNSLPLRSPCFGDISSRNFLVICSTLEAQSTSLIHEY